MTGSQPLQGELQTQILRAVWRTGGGSVEEIRDALADEQRGAYTTIQTVLNRLVERGLLERTRVGRGFRYSALVSEEQYVTGAVEGALKRASHQTRASVLASLIGALDEDELNEIRRLAEIAQEQRER